MAEFKLGRIRFVWKQDWVTGTTYYKDDIVRYGGRTYLCVEGHTAAEDFYTDLDNIPTKWNQFADGQAWKGDWTASTLYKENDIVKYGGYIYICNNGHISNTILETNQEDWDLFAESFDWKSNWVAGTVYKVNDIIKYGGYTYLCNTAHTAAETDTLGLEADQSKWDIFSKGFDWKTDWAANTRYKVGDVVKYGGTTYVCNTGHTAASTDTLGLEADQSKWDYFNRGFEYKGQWVSDVRYKVNDLVKNGGGVWICVTDNTSTTSFTADQGNWEQYVEGIEFENDWLSTGIYQNGDIVRYGGNSYIAKTSHDASALTPPSINTTDWDLFATGFRFAGDWNSTTLFKVGEIVRNQGFTYLATVDSTNVQPPNAGYWTKMNDGFKWQGTWTNGAAYVLGDTVKYGPISYICVQAHTAATATNRPDVDTLGTYWNQLTSGNESDVMTTTGDLVYRSGSGVTRLPIGDTGQVLTVSNDDQPEWAYFGRVKKVYYVAPHGVNQPAPTYGLTIDQPWATVRYATEQVLAGTEYPNAAHLIRMNRTFIQSELTQWVIKQIADGTGIWAGFVNDSQSLCERDVGLIVDALVYDLSHTGNSKTLEATNSYFTDLGVLETFISDEEEQLVEAINYVVELIGNVISNTAPTVNYQVLNGVTDPVKQIIDATYTAEAGAETEITALASIITDALTAGTTDNLPAPDVAGYTINVKTGQYYEVLPIRIPANTALVGDELRGTRVSPQVKVVPTNDKAKSVATLQHIQSITSSIITNTAVIPTAGNTETQNLTDQKAGTGTTTTAILSNDTILEMKKVIELGDSFASPYFYPTPTGGTNNAFTAGYYNGARLINANIEFIRDEVEAYMDANYNSIWAALSADDKTKCRRDMGYIAEALVYDLTYGGNLMTVVTARAFYTNGVLVEPLDQKTALLATVGHIKTFIDNIVQGDSAGWTKTPANTTIQDTSGTPGSADAATFAQARIQEIYDTIDTGAVAVPVTILPDISWVETDLQAAGQRLLAAKSYIQTEAIEYVGKYFPELVYNPATCKRDVGYIIEAIAYDSMFGSNFMSIKAASSYRRGLASTGIVLSSQLVPTLGIIDFVFGKSQAEFRYGSAVSSIINNAREIKDILNNDFSANSYVYPDPAGYDTNWFNGRRLLVANKALFADEVEAYMVANYNDIWTALGTGQVKCKRDISYIIDAITYDMTYGATSGCNLATVIAARSYYSNGTFVEPTTEKTAALAVQAYLKTFIDNIILGTTGWGQLSATAQDTSGTPGNAAAAAFAQDRIQEIYDTINTGVSPSVQAPSTTWVSSEKVAAKAKLDSLKTIIQSDSVAYIKREYPTLNFNEALCSRDVGYIIDALGYDMMFGSNFLSIQNGLAYRRGLTSTAEVLVNQLSATSEIIDFIGQRVATVAATTNAELADYLWSDIIGYVNSGASPIVNGTNTPTTDLSMIYSGQILMLNAEFLAAEAAAYNANTYSAIATTVIGGGTNTIEHVSGELARWMQIGDEIRFSGTVFGGVTEGVSYYIAKVIDDTTFQISETLGGAVMNLTNGVGTMTVNYHYNVELCKKDIRHYVESIAYDMMYTGNFKSTLAARYYRNALTGSKLEDFYYITNGCGVRNMSLTGLDGTSDGNEAGAGLYPDGLYAANEFGTRRPVSGSYVSLDPGWGPNDTSVWVTTKSTYVQNVTTFGDGCTGQKIDGSIHNGGLDSMVSNDFTQVLSNGIGAWITNMGRAELVSVFTYYGHVGYLAENGGKIRATNGNNSYGDFGSVAEGIDIKEIPVLGQVNNQSTEADVRNTITSGNNILAFEYGNAGSGYTNATYSISGSGFGAAAVANEFRDAGVFQIRLTDLDLEGPGGAGYIQQGNVAQTGDATSITLAVSDTASSAAYVGMSIYIIAGTGAGQYGYIQAYNASTKVASVYNESTDAAGWEHLQPGTPIATALDGTTQYMITPRVTVDPPPYSSTAQTLPASAAWSAVGFGNGVGTYTDLSATGSVSGTLASFDVSRVQGTYKVSVNTSGVFYEVGEVLTIPGTTLGGTSPENDISITVEAVNSPSGSIRRISYTGTAITPKFVALASGSDGAAVSENGETWTAITMPSSETYTSIAYGAFSGIGYYVVTASGTANSYYSTDGNNWTLASMPGSATWKDVAYGNGRFVAINSGSSTTAVNATGTSWSAGGALPNTNDWSSITYGKGSFVAVASTSTNVGAYSTNNGATWTSMTLPSTGQWTSVAYGRNMFVAVRTGSTAYAYSVDGITWVAGTLPGSVTNPCVTYGQGVFIITSDDGTTAYTSQAGIVWTTRTLSTGANPKAVVHGNPNSIGQFAMVASGTGTVASQTKAGATAKARAYVASNKIAEIWVREPGSNYTDSPVNVTITDPNNTKNATVTARVGDGALAQPMWTSRGTGYTAATATIVGDGYADNYQIGTYIGFKNLTGVPLAGSNIQIASISDIWYRLVTVSGLIPNDDGTYNAILQVSPPITVAEAPEHETGTTIRIRYSQVRLTGHDFLDIGTGGFTTSNYPNLPLQEPNPANETIQKNGGRVFYTSTDQDGNFRVGGLFNVEQATGIATLNADAFNIAGLNELSLGSVALGGSGATITEFSTDPFFTQDSDSVIPTQRAIKAYITSQIGGGESSLNVNTLTAGVVYIAGQTITTTTNTPININTKVNFKGGVVGDALVLNYFLLNS